MTSEDFKLLNDFIVEKCGISYNEKQKYIFSQKLNKRVEKNGLSSFKEYYYLLKYSKDNGSVVIEWKKTT